MDSLLSSFQDFTPDFLLRFGLNCLVLLILARYLYFPSTQNRDMTFSHLMLGTMIFLVAHFMNHVKLSLGFAFGVFAIFRILRFRADAIGIKDLTFMLVIIATAVMNSLTKLSVPEFILVNSLIVTITALAQSQIFIRPSYMKLIEYEKIELIQPERRTELFSDLEKRTGLKIERIEVGDLDFLKDVATIKIFHRQPDVRRGLSSNLTNPKQPSSLGHVNSNSSGTD